MTQGLILSILSCYLTFMSRVRFQLDVVRMNFYWEVKVIFRFLSQLGLTRELRLLHWNELSGVIFRPELVSLLSESKLEF